MTDRRYVTGAEMAKEVRAALKVAFPAVRFSVTSKRYAGGSSVSVRWEDGPTVKRVEDELEPFNGKHFDGMTDSSYTTDTILPTGERVCYASYLFCYRQCSAAFLARVYGAVCERYAIEPLPAPIAPGVRGAKVASSPYVLDDRRPILGSTDTVQELVYRHGANRLYPDQWYPEPELEPDPELYPVEVEHQAPARHLRLLA